MFSFNNNKFHAKKSGSYDSKAEIMVERKLRTLEQAGLISMLRRNKFSFEVVRPITETITEQKQLKTKVKIITKTKTLEKPVKYTPDFLYYDNETNEFVACEVKSFITKQQKDYPIRRKLFKWKIIRHNSKGKKPWRFEEIEV